MPLNRKMICPDSVAGGSGTTHVVENEETGVPVLFVQDEKVIQPLPNDGSGPPGRSETLPGISGTPVVRC